jgi:hypothetical protein
MHNRYGKSIGPFRLLMSAPRAVSAGGVRPSLPPNQPPTHHSLCAGALNIGNPVKSLAADRNMPPPFGLETGIFVNDRSS